MLIGTEGVKMLCHVPFAIEFELANNLIKIFFPRRTETPNTRNTGGYDKAWS